MSRAQRGCWSAPEAPETWYDISDMRRLNTPVLVRWAWWQGTALFYREKANDKPRWVEARREGQRRYLSELPPREVRRWVDTTYGERLKVKATWLAEQGWGEAPDGWRPLEGMAWPDPLPAPLPLQIQPGRFVSIGKVRFDAAEAAREMEEWREAARSAGRSGQQPDAAESVEERIAGAWWRDVTRITWSERGAISRTEAEGRVMRALYFLGGGILTLGEQVRQNAAVLADLKRAADLAFGRDVPEMATVPRVELTQADTPDRLLEAMRWVCELRLSDLAASRQSRASLEGNIATRRLDGEKRVCVLDKRARNVPWSFSEIGEWLDVSRPRAKQLYDDGIERIWRIANAGTPTLDRVLGQVQAGNRAYGNKRHQHVAIEDVLRGGAEGNREYARNG